MTSLRLAVIGAGHLGKIHARLAKQLPGVELVAVVEPISEARAAIGNDLQVPTFASHRECCSQIDAAIIATPTKFHYDVAADLLRLGVHTFIEKPITLAAHDADELILIAERQQLVLQVGHVERFNPAFQAALPELGRPLYVSATRCGPYTCRSTDIGVVLDLMIHDLDLALSLQTSELVRVEALGMPVFGPHEDMAQARLCFADGGIVDLQASRVSPTAQRAMDIYFETGFARLDFAAKSAEVIRPSEQIAQGNVNVDRLDAAGKNHLKEKLFEEYLPKTTLAVTDHNAILEEQRNFVQAIRGEAETIVTGRDGRRAVDAAERILASLAEQAQTKFPAGWRLDTAREPLRAPHFARNAQAAAKRRAS